MHTPFVRDKLGTFHEVASAAVNVGSSGDNTLLAAASGQIITVFSVMLISDTDVTIRFESGAGGTALTGAMAPLRS